MCCGGGGVGRVQCVFGSGVTGRNTKQKTKQYTQHMVVVRLCGGGCAVMGVGGGGDGDGGVWGGGWGGRWVVWMEEVWGKGGVVWASVGMRVWAWVGGGVGSM